MRWWVIAGLVGCGGGSDGETDGADGGDGPPDDGACGEIGTAPVQVLGELALADGSPAGGAAVRLEERNWNNPIRVFASGTTDPAGRFELAATIDTVADCWGTAVDYYVIGELGTAYGERGVNSYLFNAVEGTGAGVATLDVPIPLFEPGTSGY
jgi:hypothetical protein